MPNAEIERTFSVLELQKTFQILMLCSSAFWPAASDYAPLIGKASIIQDHYLHIWRLVGLLLSCFPLVVVLTLDPMNFIFYLTDWGLLMTCAFFFYSACLSLVNFQSSLQRAKIVQTVVGWRGHTFLYELAWTTEFTIFLCYWVTCPFLNMQRTLPQQVSSSVIHSVPFGLLLTELVFCRTRFLKLHFLILQLVYCCYSLVNWLYVFLNPGKIPIYPHVTWDNLETAMGIAVSELVAFGGFMLAYILGEYKYKQLEKNNRERGFSDHSTEPETAKESFLSTV